jgi:hypothetical protein
VWISWQGDIEMYYWPEDEASNTRTVARVPRLAKPLRKPTQSDMKGHGRMRMKCAISLGFAHFLAEMFRLKTRGSHLDSSNDAEGTSSSKAKKRGKSKQNEEHDENDTSKWLGRTLQGLGSCGEPALILLQSILADPFMRGHALNPS